MKVVLIVIGSLLLVGVVYLILQKKKETAAATAALTVASTTTKVNPALVVASAVPVDTTVYDSTSGTVSSKPKPKPIVVVATTVSTVNCKLLCDAKYPFSKSKRESCRANC